MPAPQTEVGGWAYGQKFVLNLYHLCFKHSEFVLSSFTRYLKNKFGDEEMLPPIEFQDRERCQKFVLNLCYLCFKVPEFLLLSTLRYKLSVLDGLRKR